MSSSNIGNVPNIVQMNNSSHSIEGKRIDDVSSSVNKQIKTLEDQLVTGFDHLQLFKEEADQIRKEIDVMMNVLIEKTEVVQDELHVETRKDYK
jgi:chromosome segregation ATPase